MELTNRNRWVEDNITSTKKRKRNDQWIYRMSGTEVKQILK